MHLQECGGDFRLNKFQSVPEIAIMAQKSESDVGLLQDLPVVSGDSIEASEGGVE